MFVELMPLLAGRTVLITVAKVDDKTLRVNVIPHGKADDNPALSTPLTYTGPPEELDAELGKHLAGSVLKIDPQTWRRTRRWNKHARRDRQRQDDGSDPEPDQARVNGQGRHNRQRRDAVTLDSHLRAWYSDLRPTIK